MNPAIVEYVPLIYTFHDNLIYEVITNVFIVITCTASMKIL